MTNLHSTFLLLTCQKVKEIIVVVVQSLSRALLFATPWTVACQAPLSMGFSRQEYWSGLPFPSPGDLPDPGIEHGSPTLHEDSFPSQPPGKPKRDYSFSQIKAGPGLISRSPRLVVLSSLPTTTKFHYVYQAGPWQEEDTTPRSEYFRQRLIKNYLQ